MDRGAHDRHALVLVHRWLLVLQLRSQVNPRRSALGDGATHSKVCSDTFVPYEVLLRDVAELSVMCKIRMIELLLERGLAISKASTLLPRSLDLGRLRGDSSS